MRALLTRVLRALAHEFVATLQAKLIEVVGIVGPIIWLLFSKPASVWERAAPFLWAWLAISAVHLFNATVKVWKEIGSKPKTAPARFKLKLSVELIALEVLLAVLAYVVQREEAASVRTYAYLAPTAELMECQKRAFFVKSDGPRILSRVEVELTDNKSGQSYVQTFSEIDPGPLRSDQFFWFTPSSPWDEDYTITATSPESHSSQKLIVRSTQQQIQFATQVTVDAETSPALSCRDKLLPPSYTLAAKETRSCAEPMKLPDDEGSSLDVYSYQNPNGSFTIRKPRPLPSPSDLDQQSDQRHLTDYQKQLLRPAIKQYAGSRLRVFYSGGPNTLAYAEEFRQLFAESWKTSRVSFVPVGDERIIDVQVTVGNTGQALEARTLLDAFQSAGIKRRKLFSTDPDARDDVVLWVGPKSPKEASPDQCGAPRLNPTPGQPHNCDWFNPTGGGICPFVPQ